MYKILTQYKIFVSINSEFYMRYSKWNIKTIFYIISYRICIHNAFVIFSFYIYLRL